jgi:pSer/pThr/pTyr-binding forkhead associated (FHA) protein
MPGLTAADALALLARLAFVVLLYFFVFWALVALRRSVRASAALAGQPSEPATLTLAEAAPVDGPVGRVVPIDRPLTIGRRVECEIVLQDDAVSGRHARIAWDTDTWQVEDLSSTNGTFVNGRRVTRPTRLKSGDALRVGNATWRVEVP